MGVDQADASRPGDRVRDLPLAQGGSLPRGGSERQQCACLGADDAAREVLPREQRRRVELAQQAAHLAGVIQRGEQVLDDIVGDRTRLTSTCFCR